MYDKAATHKNDFGDMGGPHHIPYRSPSLHSMPSDGAAAAAGDTVVIIDPGSEPIVVIDSGDSTVIVDFPDPSAGTATTTTTTTTTKYEFSQSSVVSAEPTHRTVTYPSVIHLPTRPSSSSFTIASSIPATPTSMTIILSTIKLNVVSSDCCTTPMATETPTSVEAHAPFTATPCFLPSSTSRSSHGSNILTLILGVLCILFGLVITVLGTTIWRRRRRSTRIESASKAARLDVEYGAGAQYMSRSHPGPEELNDAPTVNGETDTSNVTEKGPSHSLEGYERATFVSDDAAVGGPHALPSKPPSPPPLRPLTSIPASEPMKLQALPPLPSAFRRHRERDGGVRVGGDPGYTNGIQHMRHSSIQSYGAVSMMSDSNASTLPPPYENRYSR